MGDTTPLRQLPLCVFSIIERLWASARLQKLEGWFPPWVPESIFSVVVVRVKPGILVNRGFLDYVLNRSGLLGWLRQADFHSHANVRLRFKLACWLMRI